MKRAIKAKTEQRDALLQMAADHRAARDIRGFVNAAIEALGQSAAKAGPVADWAVWALGVTDQVDSVGRLHIGDDGTVSVRAAAVPAANLCPDSKVARCRTTTDCRLLSISCSIMPELLLFATSGTRTR